MHLVGGGRDLDLTAIVYGGFLAEAGQRAAASGRAVPRIGVVVVAERDELDGGVDWFRQALASGGPAEVLAATAEPDGDLAWTTDPPRPLAGGRAWTGCSSGVGSLRPTTGCSCRTPPRSVPR